ncbi:MAG: 50S ribosomal protein L3 [Candidatus Diapherotrites archaeon]
MVVRMGAGKPRSGSLGYYPRVRAAKHLPNFSTFPNIEGKVLPLNFVGYKSAMISVFAKNAREKSHRFGLETMVPSTVIECPPVKVVGVRVYGKGEYGLKVLGEAWIEKPDKFLRKKIKAFKQKGKKAKKDKVYLSVSDLEKFLGEAFKVVLLCQTQPNLTGIGKKKSDVFEMNVSGSVEQQFGFAKERFGKEIRVSDVFGVSELVDVRAVNKGKGFQGVVKRFGVKVHRPKSKTRRIVGSIGPWHPPVVMWTVPRAGQMGYHTRTEYNKRVLAIDSKVDLVNPVSGFVNYGKIKSDFVVLAGSIPGSLKRPIALRHAIRVHDPNISKFVDVKLPGQLKAGAKA